MPATLLCTCRRRWPGVGHSTSAPQRSWREERPQPGPAADAAPQPRPRSIDLGPEGPGHLLVRNSGPEYSGIGGLGQATGGGALVLGIQRGSSLTPGHADGAGRAQIDRQILHLAPATGDPRIRCAAGAAPAPSSALE